jgi:beta-mannanase
MTTTPTITLANLAEATTQQVFDQVARHLKKQGTACRLDMKCAYRNDRGQACAAGCLMSDDEVAEVQEAQLNTGSDWSRIVAANLAPNTHFGLIDKLQTVHDGYSPDKWEAQLAIIAEFHGLKFDWNSL